jgi:hypothetical protein
MSPARKRIEDPEGDDHIDERQAFLDWRAIAPKWVLVWIMAISFSINGFLGAAFIGLVIEKFNGIEKAQNDPKWDLLARHATILAELSVKVKQHDEDLKRIAILDQRMADVQTDIRILNNRLARKGF